MATEFFDIKKLEHYLKLTKCKKMRVGFEKKIIDKITYLRTSQYYGNEKEILLLKSKFQTKVDVVNQTIRYVLPQKEIFGTLPADCSCRGYGFFNDSIEICPPARSIIIAMKWNIKDFPEVIHPLKKYFMNDVLKIDRYNMKVCRCCIGNKKLYQFLKTEKCICKE